MAVGQMDYLTGILRRLVFRITELLEAEPTEGETERAPSSEWAFDHVHTLGRYAGASVKLTDNIDLADLTWITIPFNEEYFDKGTDFSLVTHKFTCSIAGIYLLFLNPHIYLNNAATFHFRVKVDDVVKLQTTNWNDKTAKILTYPTFICLELAVDEVVFWEVVINTDVAGGTAILVGESVGFNALFQKVG